jgi:WD40 repeat protein
MTGALVTPLLRHSSQVYSAEFSADGRSLVTAADHCARIWDAASGTLRHELHEAADEVLLAHFSPDSERVLIGTLSGTILVCRVETGENCVSP